MNFIVNFFKDLIKKAKKSIQTRIFYITFWYLLNKEIYTLKFKYRREFYQAYLYSLKHKLLKIKSILNLVDLFWMKMYKRPYDWLTYTWRTSSYDTLTQVWLGYLKRHIEESIWIKTKDGFVVVLTDTSQVTVFRFNSEKQLHSTTKPAIFSYNFNSEDLLIYYIDGEKIDSEKWKKVSTKLFKVLFD